MQGTSEHVPDWTIWTALVGGCAFLFKKYGQNLDPRLILVWLNEPLMKKHVQPIHLKLDRVCRVIDRLPGSDEAHAMVRVEDENRERWEE